MGQEEIVASSILKFMEKNLFLLAVKRQFVDATKCIA